MAPTDTIIALATPPGRSALALLRLSGPASHGIMTSLTGRPPTLRRPSYLILSHQGTILDDVVVNCWQGPHSYTGEDTVEITCHGNPLIIDSIIEACCQHGARMARAGEFTERAFLHERIDLTQAEAVMDLIQADSERALRAARALQQGQLGQCVGRMVEELLQVLAHLEAYIDFPEEDIQPEVGAAILVRIDGVVERLESLLETAPEGRHLREGFQVVICGAPNAGKSSLLNALLHRDRAIVSPLPGTTRDTIEETITLGGMTVRLIDTAGLRAQPDAIEELGIARTHEALAAADLVIHLVDPADSIPPHDPSNSPTIHCTSKSDLFPDRGPEASGWLRLSAKTGEGLAALQEKIIEHLRQDESSIHHEVLAINARHELLLDQARVALTAAREGHTAGQPPELVSSDLRLALQALAEITGEVSNEDILDRLFKNFCIGK